MTGVLAGCGDGKELDSSGFQAQLDRKAAAAKRTGGSVRLELPDGTTWDRLFVFGAYVNGDQIRATLSRELGFRWNTPPSVETDHVELLVFTDGDSLAGYVFVDAGAMTTCVDSRRAARSGIPGPVVALNEGCLVP